MLKKIGIVIVVLLVILMAVIATRPDEFTVTRSRTIAAPPEVVYAQLSDFHRWQQWSPWERLDPGMKREFSGASSGSGAVYSWAGNDDVGEGRMTITDAKPAENVVIRLEFLEPMAMTSTTGFVLTPSGQGATDVTWSMTGENNFISKGMSLFMNMDKMVGKDFEAGLARLDSVAAGSRTTAAEIPSGG